MCNKETCIAYTLDHFLFSKCCLVNRNGIIQVHGRLKLLSQVTHSEIYLHREKVCSRQARGPPEPADPPSSSGQRHSCYTLSALFLHGSPPATAEWRTSPCSLTCSKAEKKRITQCEHIPYLCLGNKHP